MSEKSDDYSLPSRQETRQMLVDLITKVRTREEVASWAAAYIVNDPPEVDDWVVWEALGILMAADLLALPDTYAMSETDFQRLLDEFELKTSSI